MRLATLLCVLGVASACAEGGGGLPTPVRPSTVPSVVAPSPPPQAPSPPALPLISVGEEVKDTLTLHGDQRVFELTARSDGTLVAHVSWERSRGTLELWLADRLFDPSPEGSIVGMLPVVAGQTCRLKVADGAPWDYDDLFVPYVLTTSIE